jgi:hypothetical protein
MPPSAIETNDAVSMMTDPPKTPTRNSLPRVGTRLTEDQERRDGDFTPNIRGTRSNE